jgi:phosphate transport system permease protein
MEPDNLSDDSKYTNLSSTDREEFLRTNLPYRHRLGKAWKVVFFMATILSMVALGILLLDIANDSFGYAAIKSKVNPATLKVSGKPLEELDQKQLIQILEENLNKNRIKTLEKEESLAGRSKNDLYGIVVSEVVEPDVVASWGFFESIFRKDTVFEEAARKYPEANVVFKVWLNRNFIDLPQSSEALFTGVRTAILGSLYVILITILVAFPIGIGASVYLQEYASDNWINRLIQTNINNLAGVPSIIYGMLGLAIFVRFLGPLTSGSIFGIQDGDASSGRTILSAGLTMAMLILPVIIINGQEAIKTVPNSLREASYGVGATKWQTVWSHVLPYALPGILTGTILSISRAFGETAPLVIIGASTYITFDPDSLFSKFTTLPIQIYQWTSRPQDEFRNLAAAAIIVLLVILLALNAAAVLLRNRFSRRLL